MRVAIYTRVSTSMQADEGFSLQAQYDRLVAYVSAQGWDLTRIYTDPGVSAKDLNRPGVKEMIADMKAGKFDAILVHKLDRLTRNISDLYNLVEMVNKLEIKLISLSENIDTSSPMGRMFIYLLGIFAQMFRENLSEEVKKGLRQRAEQGLRNAFAPVGYRMDENGHLEIEPEEAEFVREVFRLLLEKRWGYYTIAKYFNRQNKIGARGGIYHGSTIEKILKNYTYIGKNHWNEIIRDAGHEPIIDEDTFNRAQMIINRRSRKEMSRSHYDYPFSSILHCGRCGKPYHGMTPRHGYYIYRCFGKTKGLCDQSDLSEIKLEKLFFNYFKFYIQEMAVKEAAPAKEDHTRERIERELSKSEQRRHNWQYAFGDGKLPYEDYVKLIDDEMLKVQDWQQQLENVPEVKPVKFTPQDIIQTIAQLRENWPYLERATKKDIIGSLFKRIVILKEGSGFSDKWSITEVEEV